jgi:hypothetical protein
VTCAVLSIASFASNSCNVRAETPGASVAPAGDGSPICNVCEVHYVIADARSYACSGHWNGGACRNHLRVRRDAIERVILGGARRDLLAPEGVERMAAEMHAAYAERMREIVSCARCWGKSCFHPAKTGHFGPSMECSLPRCWRVLGNGRGEALHAVPAVLVRIRMR